MTELEKQLLAALEQMQAQQQKKEEALRQMFENTQQENQAIREAFNQISRYLATSGREFSWDACQATWTCDWIPQPQD